MPGTEESHTVLLDDLAAWTGPQGRQVAAALRTRGRDVRRGAPETIRRQNDEQHTRRAQPLTQPQLPTLAAVNLSLVEEARRDGGCPG
jgi:hypothetical protein